MTKKILSGFAGVASTHLTMIENGSKQPNSETVLRIASALNMRPSKLVARIEQAIANNGKNE